MIISCVFVLYFNWIIISELELEEEIQGAQNQMKLQYHHPRVPGCDMGSQNCDSD